MPRKHRSPNDSVLNLVRKAAQRAHRRRFVGRIFKARVGLCKIGKHNLGVTLGCGGTTFQQRFPEIHTSSVDIVSGLHGIQRIRYETKLTPRCPIEDVLGRRVNMMRHGSDLAPQIWAHTLNRIHSTNTFLHSKVLGSKPKLTIQVVLLDGVVVHYDDASIWPSSKAHDGDVGQHLTADSMGAAQEIADIRKLSQYSAPKTAVCPS